MFRLLLVIYLLIVHSMSSSTSLAAPGPPTITAEEARRLVYEALPEPVKHLPGLTLLPDKAQQEAPKCTTFDVLWANPEPASVHVGFWAVDMRTGEVWTPILCERVTNTALSRMQESIRKRLGVTTEEYRRALKDNPCCTPDPFARPPGSPPKALKKQERR